MDIILKFISRIIDIIYSYIPFYGVCVVLLALLGKLLFIFAAKKYYNSIKLSEVIAPLVKKNNHKYAGNRTRKAEELTKILASNNYPIFGGISNLIVEAIFSLGLIGIFNNPSLYLTYATSTEKLLFLYVDLTSTPIFLLQSPIGNEVELFISFSLVVMTLGIFIFHDKIMEKYSFVEQATINKITWVIFAICFLCFNQAFTLYWFSMKIMDLIHIFIVKKYFTVTRTEGNNNVIKKIKIKR
ncbi:MAG: YidC/Oxa1 family membrane protein insertase [Eubacteriales bacterium]